ncbi:MAG TPA: helix-turn-helix domain-containing protein [Solirubrobacterales bacterium]|nr:helix-turn-helix domain-containing protein [Solirubrobacterales bacterium]
MAKVRTPRSAWIEAAMGALAAGGPEAVRVEALAKQLGVSKGGFYWHFKDREALLAETFDAWERAVIDDVIVTVEGAAEDPRARLRRLFAMASGAKELFAVELALRDWSRRDRAIAKRLRRVDDRRMDFLRSLFGQFCGEEDAEARAMLAYTLFIGSYFVAGGHGKRRRAEVVKLALDRLLAERWE